MIIHSASLIPYLVPEKRRFYLRLFAVRTDNGRPVTDCPFSVVSDAAPFSRVYSAALHSDADQSVLPLLLLVQNDAAPGDNTVSSLDSNVRVEKQWQNLFAVYSRPGKNAALIVLQDQLSPDNTLLPFDPLFFCREKEVFFPPVCPRCGQALLLCRDDDMLGGYGLSPYSTTLRRYLFCDACTGAGGSPLFYALSKMPGDPEVLIDRDGLIQEMANPDGREHPGQAVFPCPGCPLQQACYGPEKAVLARVSVFSFYPFYMLVFNADRIGARDRGALLSGDVFRQTEGKAPGKSGTGESRPDITDILKRILHRWQSEKQGSATAETPPRAKPAAPEERAGLSDIQETVIISKRGAFQGPSEAQAGNDLQKTRILRPAPEQADARKLRPPANAGTLEKTRIITRPANGLPSAGPGPGGLPEGPASRAAWQGPKPPVEPDGGDDPMPGEKPAKTHGDPASLEKTVIISRGKTGKKE